MSYQFVVTRQDLENNPFETESAVRRWVHSFSGQGAAVLSVHEDFERRNTVYEVAYDSDAWTG